MGISNEERSWILACVSGVACVLGSCIICIDLVCRLVPKWRAFSILESTTFLAASLSLSFGVMFFSSLYSLLPEARDYFYSHGYRKDTANFAVIGFFLVGVLGLQIISELLHRCLPSSIVNCEEHAHDGDHHNGGVAPEESRRRAEGASSDEFTPLLDRRPSLKNKISGSLQVVPKKILCAGGGTCYGYSDHACDQKCNKRERESVHNGTHDHGNGQPAFRHQYGGSEDMQTRKDTPNDHEGHHHVVKNRFLSIGLQTSIAIALHKFPEGFITYATNYANQSLGFTVFVALFVHNIAEGFAMALPLFMALRSRLKAVVWASLLGGLAQPAGAAAAWLSIRGRDFSPDTSAYGILFAITAGIMCSVGLQLFSQAVKIYHGQRLPFIMAFLGMGLLGFASALTATED